MSLDFNFYYDLNDEGVNQTVFLILAVGYTFQGLAIDPSKYMEEISKFLPGKLNLKIMF